MMIDVKNMISITEANQNFSKLAKQVDKEGKVVILKNNKPRYVVSVYEEDNTKDDKLLNIAKSILQKYKYAFEVLGK